MKITSKQGNGNKVHIYIDGEYTLTLYDDYWYLCGIKDGQEISETQLASLKEEAGFRSAYEKGITYLSMRAYSEKELYDKLKLKFGAESARRAVDKMLDRGYIDDEAFCKEYARYLFDVKVLFQELCFFRFFLPFLSKSPLYKIKYVLNKCHSLHSHKCSVTSSII